MTKKSSTVTKKKRKKEFDPDQLVLTKQEILEFCDKVLAKWNKNPKENAQNIIAMNAVRMSVLWTEEDQLKAIWAEILRWTFELLYRNAIAQAREENVNWSHDSQNKNKKLQYIMGFFATLGFFGLMVIIPILVYPFSLVGAVILVILEAIMIFLFIVFRNK